MSTRETVQVGKTYYIEHRRSTMATIATVLKIENEMAEVRGHMSQPSYFMIICDWRWTEHK